MKNINELTPEEVVDLISYTIDKDGSGPTIYYDKISATSSRYIIYDGSTVESLTPEQLVEIAIGKANYELYKVISATHNAEDFIKTQADVVIAERYESTLESHLSLMTDRTDRLVEVTQSTLSNLNMVAKSTDDMCLAMAESTKSVKASLEEIDVKSLQADALEVSESFKPLKQSLQSTINELQSLFK